MFGLTKQRVLVGVAAGLVLVTTAACSSSGGAASREPRSQRPAEGGGATVDTPRYTFAMISHAPAGDTFFDVIQNGAEDAAAKDNVEFKYSGSGTVPEQANADPERDRQQGRRHRGQHARPGRADGADQGRRRRRHPGRHLQRR